LNVLLLAPNERRGRALCDALESRGIFVRLAKDAIYVLTMAERASIDMVFVSARIEAMDAVDFASIVTSDPGLASLELGVFDAASVRRTEYPSSVRFVDHDDDSQLVAAIAARIKSYQQKSQQPPPGGWKSFGSQEISMIGMFEMTTFPDLLQMVCASVDHGTIVIQTPFDSARIGFSPERVQSIKYRRNVGIAAMALLMEDIEEHPRSQFRVSKSPPSGEKTEGYRPEEVLLEVAVMLDGQQENDGAVGVTD